jgi:glycolate oxidase FAD binding subunit
MEKLQDTLAAENQWLPNGFSVLEGATIGGAIACDVSGSDRYGYGTLRDYVIGITVVNDRGEETHAGGRVVKNVAGYDFMKLHTGALGTLGVITQVTLKVKPKPEHYGLVSAVFTKEHFQTGLDAVAVSTTRPISVSALSFPNAKSGSEWHVSVGFHGSDEAVRWQEQTCALELRAANAQSTDILGGNEIPPPPGEKLVTVFRVQLTPTNVVELANLIAGPTYENAVTVEPFTALVEGGVFGTTDSSLSRVRQILEDVECLLRAKPHMIVIEDCPVEWKKSLNIWCRPPADLALQKAVKRALDPQNLFNPGRFVTEL